MQVTCVPDDHLNGVTYTRYRIDTIESPDYEHLNARNMQRIEIDINKKELCVKLVITQNYLNTLRTGEEDLRFYITTVQDG